MTTQAEIRSEMESVYHFLQMRANARGMVLKSQQDLANEMNLPLSRLHRLLHRLEDEGRVRIAGGGRQGKTIQVLLPELTEEPTAEVPGEAKVAQRLFDALGDFVRLCR